MKPLIKKVAGFQLYCENCEIFKSNFLNKTSPETASEKFINFSGKHQSAISGRGVIDLSF